MLKSGAELERIFDRDESGKVRKYGSSFSRREVKTGDANFGRRMDLWGESWDDEAERSGLEPRRVERRRER